MKNETQFNYVSFFTATVLNWNTILFNDHYKDIIISSLKFLVNNGRIKVFAFVIMPSHIHIVWKIENNRTPKDVQRDFLKFTAQQIKFEVSKYQPEILKTFYVGAKDREFQIWERNPLTSRLPTIELIEQKINYIHLNPVRGKWNLCKEFTDYRYSSAGFYHKGNSEWDFLTHYLHASLE